MIPFRKRIRDPGGCRALQRTEKRTLQETVQSWEFVSVLRALGVAAVNRAAVS